VRNHVMPVLQGGSGLRVKLEFGHLAFLGIVIVLEYVQRSAANPDGIAGWWRDLSLH